MKEREEEIIPNKYYTAKDLVKRLDYFEHDHRHCFTDQEDHKKHKQCCICGLPTHDEVVK